MSNVRSVTNTLTKTGHWPNGSTQRERLLERQREALHEYRINLTAAGRPYRCEICHDTEIVVTDAELNAAMPCPACSTVRRAERLQRICGLTDDERKADLSQIVITSPHGGTARMVAAARAFIETPRGMLTIYGSCGNAKTVVLQSIVNAMLARNIGAIYATFYDVVTWIKESFSDASDISAELKVKQLVDTPVLCIDELDKVKSTDWVMELKTHLLDARYRRGLAGLCGTVFAMNASIDTLPDWMYSRLRDGRNVVVENNDRDMRPLMK